MHKNQASDVSDYHKEEQNSPHHHCLPVLANPPSHIRQPALQALRVCALTVKMVSSFLIWQASTHLASVRACQDSC